LNAVKAVFCAIKARQRQVLILECPGGARLKDARGLE